LPDEGAGRSADLLGPVTNLRILSTFYNRCRSLPAIHGNSPGEKYFAVVSPRPGLLDLLEEPEHQVVLEGLKVSLRMGPTTSRSAAWLRKTLPFLAAGNDRAKKVRRMR